MNLFKSFFAEIAVALHSDAELSSHFTPRAREMFAFAQDESTRLNHNFIETEHVLLGLLKLDRGVAANVLKRHGVDLRNARAGVEEYVGHTTECKNQKPPFLSPRG